MEQGKGTCKHGTFDIREGCPQCIAERNAGEKAELVVKVTAPEGAPAGEEEKVAGEIVNLAETIAEVQGAPKPTAVALRPGEDLEAHGYFEEAQKLLEYATALVITSDEIVKGATNDLSIISKLKKAMEGKKREYLDPLRVKAEAIRETYSGLMDPILRADKITRGKILTYRQEQERQRQEAEEIARMEREAAERKAALTGEPVVAPEPTEKMPESPDHYRSEMGTLGKSVLHKWEVIDFAQVPDDYKKIDAGAITNVVKASKGKIVIPGIRIWDEESLRVTTKKEGE